MDAFLSFLPVLAFCLAMVGLGFLAVRWERKQARTWTAVAEGEFGRVEHREYTYSRRTGAMVHTTTRYRATMTIVHFADGRSFAMDGRHDPDIPPGTRVRVYRNGLGGHRLERLA